MDKKSWNKRGYPDLEGQFCLCFDNETLGFYDEDLPIYNEFKAELDRKAKKLLKEVQEINPAIITEHPFNQLVSYVGN
jgi:hypothetical protein